MTTLPDQPNPSPRRVAYVLRKFPVLSETFILNEILALEARGVRVHIFSLERPNDPRFHENLPLLEASISYVPDLTQTEELEKYRARVAKRYEQGYKDAEEYVHSHDNPTLALRLLQSCYIADQVRRYDVVHFHAHFATRPTSVAFFASLVTGLPYSFTAHAMDIFKTHLSVRALKRKIEHARFVVTISDFNRRLLVEVAPECTSTIKLIYNGIDLERFCPGPPPPRNPFTFLCVARLVEKKGHTILVEACARLRDRGVPFQCLIIGKGRLRSPVEHQIKKARLGEHVKLLGPLRSGEVREHFRDANASVLACIEGSDGNKDGLPVSIVEALACSLPVVTTPMTGIPEVVEHEKNGLLVPFHDAERLAAEMERLVTDYELYENLRAGARPSVADKFDVQHTIAQLENLFQGSVS